MNKAGLFVSKFFSALLVFLRERGVVKTAAEYIVKSLLNLTGLKGRLVFIIVKKFVAWGLMSVEKGLDYTQNHAAAKEIVKEAAKPYGEIDWDKIEKLEKELWDN